MTKQRKNPVQHRQASTAARPQPSGSSQWQHYDLKRNWWKVKPRLSDPIFQEMLHDRRCYWVNVALRLAMLAEPRREWRILTSHEHSTVWDGRHTVLEFEFSDLGIPPRDCFWAAYDDELQPGEYLDWPPRRRRPRT